ncbi:hypothetical protein B0T26DRAFT_703968 [Lasiosphaeria miniovina]|uniref:Uncharacterized protein n=1 Tax=Lasiosphaeria miniovina TaxID=1954250 RepID=A0AA40AVH7_9PEZI|nr:uncharacterized protein B0T26DRAFT_703968 [Lasiosphaeria miniovina]KAK0722785.1 hypothetical protein B0T26DRAFT_703968 [Lasiosphaeria miniovina]
MEPPAAAVSTRRDMTADSHKAVADSEDQEMTDAAQGGKDAATTVAREASINSGDNSSSQQHDNHHRNVRESTAATTRTMAGAELANVLDAVDPRVELHSTFTMAKLANAEATRTFLELARPDNSRIEDNHFYKTHIRPSYEAQFDAHTAAVVDGGKPETLLQVEWDPPAGPRYRWPFFCLRVEVVESLLRSSLDIGGMVVDGGAEEGTRAGVRAAEDGEMSEED